MLSFSHTLISLPFAYVGNNPVLIFLAAFVFHLFADTLLHWNIFPHHFKRYPYAWVALDILGGVLASWFVTGDQFFTIPVWAAIIGGNLPDVWHGLWEFIHDHHKDKYFWYLKPFFVWHDKLQLETLNPLLGLASQIILIVVSVLIVTNS